jgi:hypothetical protein
MVDLAKLTRAASGSAEMRLAADINMSFCSLLAGFFKPRF